MIRIDCPFCGVRDHGEFHYGQDGTIQYPDLEAPMSDWAGAVFERENRDGVITETWHHVSGCRMWLVVERDTRSHAIYSVKPAHPGWAKLLPDPAAHGGQQD